MNNSVVTLLSVALVSIGALAELNLMRIVIGDWRKGRRAEQRRRLRATSICDATIAVTGAKASNASHRERGTLAAAVACALITPGAVAQTTSSSTSTEARRAPTTQATAASASQVAEAAAPSALTTGNVAPFSVQLNLDFTNAYFYRGIRQQDKGLIVQPAARVTTRLVDDAELKLDGFFGTWNSFGPNAGAETGGLLNDWYEADMYAGLSVTLGKLSLATSYTFLTSPSDAFQAVQELGFTLALDDSEWLKAFALKPSASLAIETGANGSDGPDLNNGVYLELGIAPGFSFDVNTTPITMTFPASVGLSLSDYYQDAGGSDDAFGFAQVGVKASVPLGEPGRFGAATLNAGVSVLMLGDHTKAFNKGDGTEVIGTVGVQWNY